LIEDDELEVKKFFIMFCFISYNESRNIMLVVWVYDVVADEVEL
jgi:hypothetical protein